MGRSAGQTRPSIQGEHHRYAAYHLLENRRRRNHVQALKAASESCFGEREKTSEVGLGSELGCNPDDLRVELAGYWSRLLVRVKEQSEVVDGKNLPEEIKP